MVRCVSCDATRGFWGRFTWTRCDNKHFYCPTYFGGLPESSDDRSTSRVCRECGVQIRISDERFFYDY